MKKGFFVITVILLLALLVDVLFNIALAEEIEKCFSRTVSRRGLLEREALKSSLYAYRKKIGFDYNSTIYCLGQSLSNKLVEPFTAIGIHKRTSFGLYYYLTMSSKGPPAFI